MDGPLRGFARSRSNFDVRLQDLEGKFHLASGGPGPRYPEMKPNL